MKILVGIFFLFNYFYLFSQKIKDDFTTKEISGLNINKVLNTLDFDEKADSSLCFDFLKKLALSQIKSDTMIILSYGSEGYCGRGCGQYDSITTTFDFVYYDATTNCDNSELFDNGVQFYNEIIELEIKKRYDEDFNINLEKRIKVAKNISRINRGLKADIKISINNKIVDLNDSIDFLELQNLSININNYEEVIAMQDSIIIIEPIILQKNKPVYRLKKQPFTKKPYEVIIGEYDKFKTLQFNTILIMFEGKYSSNLGHLKINIKNRD